MRRRRSRRSDDVRVTDAFRTWMLTEGWTPVDHTDSWADVEAVCGDERLICEVNGRTSENSHTAIGTPGSPLPAPLRSSLQIPRT